MNNTLPGYLQTLEWPNQPGRFLPCKTGVTEVGRQMALGFSCFALKLYHILGLWSALEVQRQTAWIAFLKSFQAEGYAPHGRVSHNAFIDPPLVNYLLAQTPWQRRLIEPLFRPRQLTYTQKVIIAETKQVIATLAEVDQTPRQPYQGFPVSAAGVKTHLLGLDWTRPWGAGGQASALVVFLKLELPRLADSASQQELLSVCRQFFDSLADAGTGAYFKGASPKHGQLVNGAMKVLTALDWLEAPIHYPERLIDTCLQQFPIAEGCHMVDVVYVLYRCLQQTDYQKAKVQAYCAQVFELIKQHHQPDGGFSYYLGCSQTTYYSTPISQGLPQSDIHGTCLLTWALAMTLEILENNLTGWRVIRP
ncbi:MAG: hypothetical protein HC875_15185 [Anaerolineales bacterium]|nr:hypothetical protein [Anaerolineales bacterium]